MDGDQEMEGPGLGSTGGPSGGGDINLGQPPMGGPGMAEAPPVPGAGPPAGPIYPSVMLTGDAGLSRIPDKGRALIKHSVISRRTHIPQHGPHKGKTRHEVEIHLHSIRPIRGYKKAEAKNKVSDDERAMRKMMGDTEAEE